MTHPESEFLKGLDARDTTLALLEMGYWPIPIYGEDAGLDAYERPLSGRPIGLGWGRARHTPADLSETFRRNPSAGAALGIGIGRAPGGRCLVDFEVDDDPAGPALGDDSRDRFLGEPLDVRSTLAVQSRRGIRSLFSIDSRTWLAIVDGALKSVVHPADHPGLEIRLGGLDPAPEGLARLPKQVCSTVAPTVRAGFRRYWIGGDQITPLPQPAIDRLLAMADAARKAKMTAAEAALAAFDESIFEDDPAKKDDFEAWRLAKVAKYVLALPASIEGCRGSDALFRAACVITARGIVDRPTALLLLQLYNLRKASPTWSAAELEHKLDDALATVTADPAGFAPLAKLRDWWPGGKKKGRKARKEEEAA
ncbi:hypothetical protein [Paludisphaera sp.]|uniref:hypothetical protein n=1 Tax=Paludisphaera sp. TaxID=2017432 RepID=UPI00301CDBF0